NRLTVRQILHGGPRRPRPGTIIACARALGLSPHDLRTQSLAALLSRRPRLDHAAGADHLRRLYEQATQPELLARLGAKRDPATRLTPDEIDELLSLQGTGGPLTRAGLAHFLHLLERRRQLRSKVDAIAGTEYLDLLTQLINLLYDKIQPY